MINPCRVGLISSYLQSVRLYNFLLIKKYSDSLTTFENVLSRIMILKLIFQFWINFDWHINKSQSLYGVLPTGRSRTPFTVSNCFCSRPTYSFICLRKIAPFRTVVLSSSNIQLPFLSGIVFKSSFHYSGQNLSVAYFINPFYSLHLFSTFHKPQTCPLLSARLENLTIRNLAYSQQNVFNDKVFNVVLNPVWRIRSV